MYKFIEVIDKINGQKTFCSLENVTSISLDKANKTIKVFHINEAQPVQLIFECDDTLENFYNTAIDIIKGEDGKKKHWWNKLFGM